MHHSTSVALGAMLLMVACDRPAPPAPPASPVIVSPQALPLPPEGTLRLRHANVPADLDPKYRPVAGLPSLSVRLEYAGPRTRLDVGVQCWHQGKSLARDQGHQSMTVPLSGEAVFSFGEGVNPEGKHLVSVSKSIPESWNPKTKAITGRISDISQYPVPPVRGRAVATYQPHWPLEVADGKAAIFWAVFVDEPPGTPPEDLEERAKKADVGFVFQIQTAEETEK